MATNPNAIFGEALATGPRQIPLSELQQQIAATRQTQAQTANIGSQMAQRQQETIGLQQQNTLRQRQLDDEQALRDTIARHTTQVPVSAPNANIPRPGVDENGDPLPLDVGYHQIAATAAVKAPIPDVHGIYADLMSQGRYAVADTFLKSAEAHRASDLEASKQSLANQEAQNTRKNQLAASVVSAPFDQQAAIAAQVKAQLEQEGLKDPNSPFGPDEAQAMYRVTSGGSDPLRIAQANIRRSESEASRAESEAQIKATEAQQTALAQRVRERFVGKLAGGDAARLNSGVAGAEDPDIAALVSGVINRKQYPNEWQEGYGHIINSLSTTGDLKDGLANLNKVAERISTAHLAQVREEAENTPGNPVYQGKIGLAGAEEQARQNVAMNFINAQGGTSQIAQDIADYKIPLNAALSNRIPLPARNAILAQVQQLNPNFNASNYAVKQKTEQDAVTGKIGTQRNALNTMMGHLDILNQAADALNNGNIQLLNRLANAVGAQTGATAKTTYETIVHRLGPEVTKAYLAGGGSVGERGTNEQDFSANLSPAQLKANVGVSAQLAASKIDALEDQYKSGTFGRGNLPSLLSPPAAAARQRLASQSPVGGPVTVTTKAAYDALPAGTPYIDSKGNRGIKGQK